MQARKQLEELSAARQELAARAQQLGQLRQVADEGKVSGGFSESLSGPLVVYLLLVRWSPCINELNCTLIPHDNPALPHSDIV